MNLLKVDSFLTAIRLNHEIFSFVPLPSPGEFQKVHRVVEGLRREETGFFFEITVEGFSVFFWVVQKGHPAKTEYVTVEGSQSKECNVNAAPQRIIDGVAKRLSEVMPDWKGLQKRLTLSSGGNSTTVYLSV